MSISSDKNIKQEKNDEASFKSTYDYGEKSERVRKEKDITAFFKGIALEPFKGMLFPGAKLSYVDPERVKLAHDQLKFIGGMTVSLTTSDNAKINGMYFKASDLKDLMIKYFDIIEANEQSPHRYLVLKQQYTTSIEQTALSDKKFTYMNPDKEAQAVVSTFYGLGANIVKNGLIPGTENTRGYVLQIAPPEKDLENVETVSKTGSHPTALIAGGSGMPYTAYKGLVLSYLLRGINVMTVDYRGFGKSSGSPSSHKTKLDLDTAYQYLKEVHKVDNTDLLVHGHCMGAGPGIHLAGRRKGINMIIDRSFADYRELARERFPIIRDVVEKIMPCIINYNNIKHLKNVKGHIAIVKGLQDVVIPDEQIIKLVEHLPQDNDNQIKELWKSNVTHTGLWTNNAATAEKFDLFLTKAKLKRKLL